MKVKIALIFALILLAGIFVAANKGPNTYTNALTIVTAKETQTSTEAFNKMMDVLTHPRCVNCHPSDNIPKQGALSHPHYFNIARGKNNSGFKATNCNTCHQSENNKYSGVPGAPHWALAPASMAWEGVSRNEIAKRLLDKKANGNRSHEALVEHMTMDDLVLWAWNPGVDANGIEREKPPVSQENFKEAVRYWFDNGAVIPTK